MYITLLKIAAPAILFVAYSWFIYGAGRDSVNGKIAIDNAEKAIAVESTETRWQSESNQVNKDAQLQINRLKTDLAAAGDIADRLRDEIDKYAQRVPSCPGAANSGSPTNGPSVVLAKLLSSCEQRAAQLARAVDESRIAGLACERAYDSVVASQ